MLDTIRGPGIVDIQPKSPKEFHGDGFKELAKPEKTLIRLDIGSGKSKLEGFKGIDIADVTDYRADLFKFPWPLEDESVAEANCAHFVEHIPHLEAPDIHPDGSISAPLRWQKSLKEWGFVRDLWFDFWEEIHRILVPGGIVKIQVPYYSSGRADQDPTHLRRMCEASFCYLDQNWFEANNLCYPYAGDFELVKTSSCVNAAFEARSTEALSWMKDHDLNIVDDISVVVKARKPSSTWWKRAKIEPKLEEKYVPEVK